MPTCTPPRSAHARRRPALPDTLAAGVLLLATAGASAGADGLTATETRWLQGAAPVIAWAGRQGLPLDIVVQPQPAAGLAPLALAMQDGRCQLVLSMRGNPEAEATLSRLPAGLERAALALMAAHELGHCRRALDGAQGSLPAGFAPADTDTDTAVPDHRAPAGLDASMQSSWREMRETRREEGYADLVGLAWVAEHHAADYPALHAWLRAERAAEPAGGHHDTRAWLALADVPAALLAGGGNPFDRAAPLWRQGLRQAP